MPNPETFVPKRTFNPLPLGTVLPRGWLREQLKIQAEGLSGHLDEFFPDLGPESAWLGGNGESWEVGPYYLDGLVPLAYLLDDSRLKAKVAKWLNWTLSHLGEDGWIGPQTDHEDIWWPRAVMLKVLAQYTEATQDRRAEPAMASYFMLLRKRIEKEPLKIWVKFRWGEYLMSLFWLCSRRPCPVFQDLPHFLHEQGYNWSDHFTHFMIENKVRIHPNLATHVVNHAMAVKYPGLYSLFSGSEDDRKASDTALEWLDRLHGCATGLFTGDEHLSGLNPSQGTELCAVVEYMYSMEVLTSLFGGTAYADRLESLAYNNLPGAFSADMWAHQYDQQANQVLCTVEKRDWTNGPDANIYGLAPNYKCCTANFSQGWPKFVSNIWMGTPDGGLAAIAYGPSEVHRAVNSAQVTIVEKTDYPFSGEIVFEIKTSGEVNFPLYLRIPGWAEGAQLSLNKGNPVPAKAGTFHIFKRPWKNNETIVLTLPMKLRVTRRYNDSAAIHRGALTFSLMISSRWKQIAGETPHADYEVRPMTDWNYALVLDTENPAKSLTVEEKSVKMPCFSEIKAPVVLTAKARKVPDWGMDGASAAPPPKSPVSVSTPVEEVKLIPYGSAKLRITEFPVTQ
ncbi:glycoside hydrolase family 127 protein [bacterium]|nr:glycoside hydrolase family 127 protein [bacterium]